MCCSTQEGTMNGILSLFNQEMDINLNNFELMHISFLTMMWTIIDSEYHNWMGYDACKCFTVVKMYFPIIDTRLHLSLEYSVTAEVMTCLSFHIAEDKNQMWKRRI